MLRASENKDLMNLLSEQSFEIIEVVDKLRRIIYKKFEDIEEKVNFGWNSISFHHKNAGYVVGIFPHGDRVKLGFEHGDKIIDKYKVFDRSSKQIKYITYKINDKIDEEIINDYLEQASLIRRR